MSKKSLTEKMIGKHVVIRGYASGVHFGELVAHKGREVVLKNSRRLWRWETTHGISLSEVALHGAPGASTRVCSTLPSIVLLDAIEIIPATQKAAGDIMAQPVAQPT